MRKELPKEPLCQASSECLLASKAGPKEASGYSSATLGQAMHSTVPASYLRPHVLGCSPGTGVVGGPRYLTQQP